MTESAGLESLRLAVEWENVGSALGRGESIPNASYWNELVTCAIACRQQIVPGTSLFRARVMPVRNEFDLEPLSEMGSPPTEVADAHRLSRKGVPAFYSARELETAVAEVRPWRGARLTVAHFVTTAPLNVANLTKHHTETQSSMSLRYVSQMLGRPFHERDEERYLASQELADACRRGGLDGIEYDSALTDGGVNLMLFAAATLACQARELREITTVSITSVRV